MELGWGTERTERTERRSEDGGQGEGSTGCRHGAKVAEEKRRRRCEGCDDGGAIRASGRMAQGRAETKADLLLSRLRAVTRLQLVLTMALVASACLR